MDRNTVINLASWAGFDIIEPDEYHDIPEIADSGNKWITLRILRLAELIVAKEREECKKACEQVYAEGLGFDEITVEYCVAAILERNNQ